jgi:hypothetical protein
LNPYVIARLATRFLLEVGQEWWQSFIQRLRRGVAHVVLQELLVFGHE